MDTHNDSVFHFVQPIHVHVGHDGVDVCDALGQPRSTLRAREDVPVARVTSEDGEKAVGVRGGGKVFRSGYLEGCCWSVLDGQKMRTGEVRTTSMMVMFSSSEIYFRNETAVGK